jgi:hypothetical protein
MKESYSVGALNRDALRVSFGNYIRSWFESTCTEGLNRVGLVSNPIPLKMEIKQISENGGFNKLRLTSKIIIYNHYVTSLSRSLKLSF